jgi:trehalose 6-phosphate phosphatase
MGEPGEVRQLPHARERIESWVQGWREHGRLVVLLDFDGTLAPIVERPDAAEMPTRTRDAVRRLIAAPGTYVAVVSGRGLRDARERAGLGGIAYAGNHGMEIEGAGLHRIHPEAAAARPLLEQVQERLVRRLADVPGALVEDKGLTLSVHTRMVDRALVAGVGSAVFQVVREVTGLRVTEGKEVLEVRPNVDWDKGRAVAFILESLAPAQGTPVIYIGDDRTDEDAFRVLKERKGGEGVLVAEGPERETAAVAVVNSTEEVAELLDLLVERAPV